MPFPSFKKARGPVVYSAEEIPGAMSLKVVTWNVGNAEPNNDLSGLLGPRGGDGVDILAIGLQECQYDPADSKAPLTAAQGVSVGMAKRVKKLSHFMRLAQLHLGESYAPVGLRELGEMKLAIFVSDKVQGYVHDVSQSVERTGLGGVIANKGGIVVTLDIGNIRLAFASSHLAAHEGEGFRERRNQDVAEIFRGTQQAIGKGKKGGKAMRDPTLQAHHVIWMGDLNYRMDVTLLDEKHAKLQHEEKWKLIKELVDAQDYASLHKADELSAQIAQGKVLSGFVEGEKLHVPTFKVERVPGLVYKDQRVPAYCDRILWRSLPEAEGQLKQTNLEALVDVITSDHKPVRGTFELSFPPPMPEEPLAPKWAQRRGVHILLTDLEASDLPTMDTIGGADPFVEVTSPLLLGPDKSFRSPVIDNSLNPVWADTMPEMTTFWKLEGSIEASHLTLQVFDKDGVGQSSDLIGTANLGLKGAGKSGGIEFRLPLTKYGVARGFISGRVSVLLGEGKITSL